MHSDRIQSQFQIVSAIDFRHLKWYEGTKRGYVSCTGERDRWKSDFLQVADVRDTASPVTTGASFVVRDGEPGVHRA